MSAEERLVGVDADTPHARILGGAQRSQAAQTRDVEHGARPAGDLTPCDGLALVRVEEVVRIPGEDADARVGAPRARPKADDEVVHRRDVDAPDGADDILAGSPLLEPSGKPAREIRRLKRLKHDRLHIALADSAEPVQRSVEESEASFRKSRCDGRKRVAVAEFDDDEVVALPGEQRQRPGRVLAHIR